MPFCLKKKSLGHQSATQNSNWEGWHNGSVADQLVRLIMKRPEKECCFVSWRECLCVFVRAFVCVSVCVCACVLGVFFMTRSR